MAFFITTLHAGIASISQPNTAWPSLLGTGPGDSDLARFIIYQMMYLIILPLAIFGSLVIPAQNRLQSKSQMTWGVNQIDSDIKKIERHNKKYQVSPPAQEQQNLFRSVSHFTQLAQRCNVPESDPRLKQIILHIEDAQRPYLRNEELTDLRENIYALLVAIYDGDFLESRNKEPMSGVLLGEKYRPYVVGFFAVSVSVLTIIAGIIKIGG